MKAFRAPERSIGSLDAATAATLVATASDVALVMDREGVIQDMAFQQSDLSLELEGYGRWVGRPWSDTVSLESQTKIATLLREAEKNKASGWRQVNHQTVQGQDIPILYSAIKLNGGERIVALGRDLRAVAALQQRLIDAQMSMERDYAKLRFSEARYRALFQTAAEPIVILDGSTHKITEANPAALDLLNDKRAIGRSFSDLFTDEARRQIQPLLSDARNAGWDDLAARLSQGGQEVFLSATPMRQEGAHLLLVRLRSSEAARAIPAEGSTQITQFMQASPDGFVLSDATGRILSANTTFTAMAQIGDADQARGTMLDQLFGRSGVDFGVMAANLRQHGSIRLFATVLRGTQGDMHEVEVSAVALGSGKTATFGFVVRDVGRRLPAPRTGYDLPHSAQQLTELIGRVSLKDLVRETTDVIEKLCIEAALELTGDNRASAAEVLGLSRQSLYVKLRRFGFADIGGDTDN